MEIRKARGIVLAGRHAGEADIIATVLTREYGKLSVSMRGIRKSRSRPRTAGEPGTLVDLLYYHNDNRATSTASEISIAGYNPAFRDDIERLCHLLYLCEVTDKTTMSGEPGDYLFRILVSGIETLADTGHPFLVSPFYTLHLLRFHGIMPELTCCASCGSTDLPRFALGVTDFHPRCIRCTGPSGAAHTDRVLEFMRTSLAARFGSLQHDRYQPAMFNRLLDDMILFIEDYFSVTLKTRPFVTSVL